MANPSGQSRSTRKELTDEQILRTGRILARLRSRIDLMLDEVEECARVATLEGESESVEAERLDLVDRKMRRILS